MQSLEMSQADLRWNKIKALGILLLGISAVMSVAAMIIISNLAYQIQKDSECENRLAAEMRASIGIGLAAVAEGDDEELAEEAENLRVLAEKVC